MVVKMADPKLLSMDERIDRIERLVFGQAEKDADYPKVRYFLIVAQ